MTNDVAVPDTRVRLFSTDSGEVAAGGPPLVLIHGWTCDSLDWVFQVDELARHHRVVTVDLRGHGRSPVTPSGYSSGDLADDVAGVMEGLRLPPAVVVGHSMGGIIGAVLAVEHPSLVRASVMVEPAYGHDDPTVSFMREAAQQFGTPAGNALAADLQAATEPTAEPWRLTWHRHRTLGMPPHAMLQAFEGMYFTEDAIGARVATEAYLRRRTSPTLAVHCRPERAEWERALLSHPYSRSVSSEGSGHWVHQERPREFNRLVLDWVAGLPGDW